MDKNEKDLPSRIADFSEEVIRYSIGTKEELGKERYHGRLDGSLVILESVGGAVLGMTGHQTLMEIAIADLLIRGISMHTQNYQIKRDLMPRNQALMSTPGLVGIARHLGDQWSKGLRAYMNSLPDTEEDTP